MATEMISLHQELDGLLVSYPPPNVPVIYFLLFDGVVVYVGATRNPSKRIKIHRKTKDFDCIMYWPCTKENIERREQDWIAAFAPKYNRYHNPAYDRFGDAD